jgi:hypothetical protein
MGIMTAYLGGFLLLCWLLNIAAREFNISQWNTLALAGVSTQYQLLAKGKHTVTVFCLVGAMFSLST